MLSTLDGYLPRENMRLGTVTTEHKARIDVHRHDPARCEDESHRGMIAGQTCKAIARGLQPAVLAIASVARIKHAGCPICEIQLS